MECEEQGEDRKLVLGYLSQLFQDHPFPVFLWTLQIELYLVK